MTDSLLERAQDDSAEPTPSDLNAPSLYINRELSWLEFNGRVLELAEDAHQQLFEQLKFLAIYTSNLDDFFMVRVAGVHGQIEARVDKRSVDGLTPTRLMEEIAKRVRELDARHARQFTEVVRPALAREGIRIVSCEESGASPAQLERHFRRAHLPRSDAARDRSRAALPLHLEPLPEPAGAPARPGSGHRAVRAREGAQGGAAALRGDRRRTRLCRSRTSSPATSTRSSPEWRSSPTASSG